MLMVDNILDVDGAPVRFRARPFDKDINTEIINLIKERIKSKGGKR